MVVEKEMARRSRVELWSSGFAVVGPSRVWFLLRRDDLLGFFGTTGGSCSSEGKSMCVEPGGDGGTTVKLGPGDEEWVDDGAAVILGFESWGLSFEAMPAS